MMKYLPVWICVCCCALSLYAAPKSTKKVVLPADLPKNFYGQELIWVKTALSPEIVQEEVRGIAKSFLSDKEATFPQLRFAIEKLKKYDKYYFFESDTEIDKRWIRQNIAYASAILNAKGKISVLVSERKTATDEYRKWYDYYMTTARQYTAVSKKPIKVQDKKKISRLNKIKAVVVEQIKAKEEAEKAKQPKLDDKKKRR